MLRIFTKQLTKRAIQPFCQNYEDYDNILAEVDQIVHENDGFDEVQLEQYQTYKKSLNKYFSNISNEEFLNRSKELVQASKLNREFNPKAHKNITDDYKNYSKYEKTFSKISKREIDLDENTESYTKNMNQFIHSLKDDLFEKAQLMDMIDNEQGEFPHKSPEQILADSNPDADFELNIQGYLDDKNERNDAFDTQDEIDENLNEKFGHQGRLSPEAKENIYRLYLEGWPVRDLSMRYGILPERVKAVIWCKQYFYTEILPRTDLMTVELALDREKMYNQWFSFMDYGIDLQDLQEREQGVLVQHWRTGKFFMKDNKNLPSVNIQEQEKTQKVPRKKSEMIVDKFVGQGNKGYLIKTQNIFQGKASERVNKKFRQIIHAGNDHSKLSNKVQQKLKQGPRHASQGYGFK